MQMLNWKSTGGRMAKSRREFTLQNPEEALTMASIMGKRNRQWPRSAAPLLVFIRRLQQGMRLQTDPTVIYGLGEGYAGNITPAFINHSTYNTYRINGLPPTPIALVSRTQPFMLHYIPIQETACILLPRRWPPLFSATL